MGERSSGIFLLARRLPAEAQASAAEGELEVEVEAGQNGHASALAGRFVAIGGSLFTRVAIGGNAGRPSPPMPMEG